MKRRLRKKAISIFLVITITVCYCTFSSAYIYWDAGYVTANFEIENRLTNATFGWHARDVWNATPTPVWITNVPGSGHSWETDIQSAGSWYGMYTAIFRQYVFWGRATKFKIELNRTTLVGASNNFWKSVLVHEFGHALCLFDNPLPDYPNSSIMNYGRDRNTLITPQTDDINGVNYAY